jgi:hypothetical protein
MRLGSPGGDHFIAHLFGERNIYQCVAVDVTDFAPP